METKHTPGPWQATRNSAFWEINPANAGDNGTPFAVADVCASAPGFPDGGLQEANARLVSAAPDLLEAAKAARDVLATAIRANWEGATDDDIADHVTIKRLDAAIAKATWQ